MMKIIYILLIVLTTTISAKTHTIGIINLESNIKELSQKETTTILSSVWGKDFSVMVINKDIPKEKQNSFFIKLGKKHSLDYILSIKIVLDNNKYTLFSRLINVNKKELTSTEIDFKNIENYKAVLNKLYQEVTLKINSKSSTDKIVINRVINNIIVKFKHFNDRRPKITGTITGLPSAGTLNIKIDQNETIHSGFKLMSKQQKINGLVNGGIFYIKNTKYGLVAKYLRGQVGKFEIGDKFDSRWYTPTYIVGNIIDEENNQDTQKLKNKLTSELNDIEGMKIIKLSRTDNIINKLTTLNKRKIFRKLYGIGIDYTILGFIKDNRVEFRVYSNYSGKILKVIF